MALFGQQYGSSRQGFSLIPPVIKSIIVANLAVYLFQMLFGTISFGSFSVDDLLIGFGALWPVDYSSEAFLNFGAGVFWPHQLLTYQFLHGGFFHLFLNMFMLWMFGAEIERKMGSRSFFMFYLLSGVGAGILHISMMPILGTTLPELGGIGPTVGASGSLYGVMVAFAVFDPNRKMIIFPLFIPVSAKFVIGGYFIYDIISGFSVNDGIAHFAHVGGGITGYLLMKAGFDSQYSKISKFFNRNRQSKSDYHEFRDYNDYNNSSSYGSSNNKKQNTKPFNYGWFSNVSNKEYEAPKKQESQKSVNKTFNIGGEEVNQERIDAILDKISLSGYQSLTENEKYILNELSKKI